MQFFIRVFLLSWMPLYFSSYVLAQQGSNIQGQSDSMPDWQMMGVGYKPGSTEIRFYEYHKFLLDSEGYITGRYVEYRNPDHSLKSVKHIRYSNQAPWTPNLAYDDYELEYQVGVDVKGKRSRLYRFSEATSMEESFETIASNTVVDAGFDAYIQHIWPRLEQGETVEFEFLAPLKLTRYPFSLKKVDSSTSSSDDLCQIEMELNWWPISLFFNPVQLEYECQTKRLMRYQGLTNLRGRDNKQYQADIRYQWRADFPPFRFN
jgi:hypothetical protein